MFASQREIEGDLESYRKLDIQQGRQNLPSSNALAPDETEVKILAQAKQLSLNEGTTYHSKTNELGQGVSDMATTCAQLKAKCEALISSNVSATADVNNQLSSEKHRIIPLKNEELELLADLNGYKALHGITWLAYYPADLLLHLSWIGLCIAIETVVNAFFFENERGLLGGAVVAFAVSVVNIGLAGVLGYFFRYINHYLLIQKVFGWACLVLFGLSTVFLNSVFSTFRSAYQLVNDPADFRQTTDAFKQALDNASSIFALHIPFTDILSFVLFFIGCLLGGYAFYKGYSIDDPYPGHGARDRRYKSARARYQTGVDDVRKSVQALHEKRQAEIIEAKNGISELGSRISRMEGRIKQEAREHSANIQRISDRWRLVLDTYRKSNTSVRATPAPSYFSSLPEVVPINSDEQGEQLVCQLDELARAFENLRTSCVDKLAAQLRNESVQTTELLGPIFSDFLLSIQKQAEMELANRRQTVGGQAH